ncbi:purine-nucleoside phosphorylase [Kineosphaera limosa]|nr:purine-nucleoside phosphorylase [Kineosphaera limosa]
MQGRTHLYEGQGVAVLGLSLVTNLAAGIGGQPLSHDEVLESGAGPRSG